LACLSLIFDLSGSKTKAGFLAVQRPFGPREVAQKRYHIFVDKSN
tara:strand:- start:347 stop:481 length:135 start_codon:yes stop_codon:yes gene_type:complete